jgi:hypothetical protein
MKFAHTLSQFFSSSIFDLGIREGGLMSNEKYVFMSVGSAAQFFFSWNKFENCKQ